MVSNKFWEFCFSLDEIVFDKISGKMQQHTMHTLIYSNLNIVSDSHSTSRP